MKAFFLSDAHLRESSDRHFGRMLGFLSALPADLDHLFIVGDLFDFWFSRNGIVFPDYRPIIDALAAFQSRGGQVHLFEGNHDFHLADYFTRFRGMNVYAESALITLDDATIYVAHGDLVDEADKGYRFLRRILRSRAFRALKAIVPLQLLWRAARMSSSASKTWLSKPQDALAGKMEDFALRRFDEGADAVILGHCHHPLIRRVSRNGKPRTFILLGDWIGHFSYAVFDSGRFELARFDEA